MSEITGPSVKCAIVIERPIYVFPDLPTCCVTYVENGESGSRCIHGATLENAEETAMRWAMNWLSERTQAPV